MVTDKVDLILPPWGSGTNFAVAPLVNKYGYPMLVDFPADKKVKTVAVVYMDDLFGLENVDALLPLLKAKGIEVVEKKSYPLGVTTGQWEKGELEVVWPNERAIAPPVCPEPAWK